MKKFMSIILTIMMFFSIMFSSPMLMYVNAATSGTTGDCSWRLDGTVLTISGNGEMGLGPFRLETLSWQKSITEVIIKEGVTSISEYAFGYFTGLSVVEISESVETIGRGAFNNCSSLYNIEIPSSVERIEAYACENCRSLTDVKFHEGITSIGTGAFGSCSSLARVKIPSSVETIGESAFRNCSSLYNIEIPSSVERIEAYTFENCSSLTDVKFHEGITSIGTGAFGSCSSLARVEIPESLEYIGDGAFFGCEHLQGVYIKDLFKWCNLTFGGPENKSYLLKYAKKLYLNGELVTNLVIPKGITQISRGHFSDCESLISVEIPEGVILIGDYAFYDCINLKTVTIPQGVWYIGGAAFCGCINLTSVEIPNGVRKIGGIAFSDCYSLSSLSIPKTVETIGFRAFYECTGLQSLYIEDLTEWSEITFGDEYTNPMYYADKLYINGEETTKYIISEGVTSIGDYAFVRCDMKSIELPSSVKKIGSNAFYSCSSLRDVWYHGTVQSRENIEISEGCTYLENAQWHYICSGKHTYKKCDDSTCEYCEWTREKKSCLFTMNNELTCEYCGYSRKPAKPVVTKHYSGTVELAVAEGMEYSKDGVTWQNSNVFSGLSGNAIYIFYQRVKATSTAQESEASEGLSVYLKATQSKPSAPTISSYTDTEVTLVPALNGEYSIDKVNWQTSNVFKNLSSRTQYTFYQRYAETETHEASESSTGTSVTTDKSKQTLIPDAPTIQSVTSSSITLTPVDGCEYSKDGITWQSSNVFTGLSCGTEYTFYQRYKETSSTLVGKSSEGTTCKTDKGTQTAPTKPSLSSKTHNSVTLTKVNGYEYSMDGINWQKSNVFTGLNPETNYLFYQRKAETDTHYESVASCSLTVKTREMYESIIVSTVPNKISYIEGKDDLDISGGKISLCYPDGATEIIDMTADMVTGFDNTIVGGQNLTVNYEGYTTTFTVQIIAKSVVSIAVTTKPNKLTYLEGESFDKTGMIVTAYYNNGTSENVTNFTISGYTSSPGNKTIIVTYNGKNTNFVVVVNAKPVTGTWKYDGIGWWYQNSNGTYPRSCWKEIDNVWYYFNASGYILTGWQSIDGIWYYFNGSGAMMTGWQSIGGTWYYFNGSGAMLTSWQSIGGTWYYFNGSGAMATGWQSIGGTWYYFNGSGAMATGWQSIGGTWYYFDGSGAMATGWQAIGETWYYFNGSGAMVTGWQSIGGVWYYFEGSGAMVANRWVGNYYLQTDGTMATNKWIGSYYVGADGVWIP